MTLSLLARLKQALHEDAAYHDATTRLLPHYKERKAAATVLAKENGVFCGAFLLKPLFKLLDPHVQIKILKKDGAVVKKGDNVAVIKGRFWALLAGERLYLNLACHLSGVATLTRRYVQQIKGTGVQILDTRKTMPLWRDLEKFAVRLGGGVNHRMSLEDAILAKDNHLQIIRNMHLKPGAVLDKTLTRKKLKKKIKFIEIEAVSLEDVWEAIRAKADVIMLDNMDSHTMKKAIALIKATRNATGVSTPLIEISGGVTLKNVKKLSQLGVDRVSIGALTHSAPALNLSLEVH